jgi:dienelactone hydrolase
MRRFHPSIEQFESRFLPTLVFVFNGNAFAAAKADNQLTQNAAEELMAHGDPAVQMNTPPMSSPAAFYQVANQIRAISKGRPIGLMGFSAGGSLALRLSELPTLNVRAALGFYGPPDLSDLLQYNKGDRVYRRVITGVRLDNGIIRLLSGPSDTGAYVIDAFGLRDRVVVAAPSTASSDRDFPDGHVYYYSGPHGVEVGADPAAFKDFLAHL